MTTETVQDNPCLPGGLIPLDQWKMPETSVHKTVRGVFKDIVRQLRVGISPEEQAFESLDDLPALSSHKLSRYAPEPDAGQLADTLNQQIAELQMASSHPRKVSFIVAPPFSGVAQALATTKRRVITPPDNLLMSEQDVSGWWDEQLGGDSWVVPELADFWLRHRSGLSLLKAFFARVAVEEAGDGLVGCSSWCWQFWCQYLPELHVGPITLAPLTGERLTHWLDYLAAGDGRRQLTARMTHDGRHVLPPPSDDPSVKYSSFSNDLACMARGNRGVALAIWQRALRAKPEENAEHEGETPTNGPKCWVTPLEQLSLPAVPQSAGRQPGHILHALLLHSGLTADQLALVTGLPGPEISLTLARCLRAELITRDEPANRYRLTPLGYPAVRKYLQSRGYPVDGF
ncbi:helix-turn-helix domain-containing protein [Marinobacter sp. SS5-14b]|uniref:MarR family transcriptional regulator n=1 Tax=Marinobacter sp. SS5-14b TaxID=3050456 RepID=UPI0026DFDEE2|nr:helix-turn-helix domain-containing protein [Marinobacter sp. SS5-14b]